LRELFQTFISDTQILGWAIAFVVFLIAEAVTLNALVSIWFAVAALLAMFAAIAGLGFVWQLAIFVVASIVLLITTKSLVKKLRGKAPDPNKDYDIGKSALVIEEIRNSENKGRVKLDGVDWAARSEDGSQIPEGETVTVKQIDGSKLIVSALTIGIK
jgi:membrane protein implicated in regulation of membrane protease activity